MFCLLYLDRNLALVRGPLNLERSTRGRGYVTHIGTFVYSYIRIPASLRIDESSSTGTVCASVCASVRMGMIHPPATRIYPWTITQISV